MARQLLYQTFQCGVLWLSLPPLADSVPMFDSRFPITLENKGHFSECPSAHQFVDVILVTLRLLEGEGHPKSNTNVWLNGLVEEGSFLHTVPHSY